MRLSGSGYNIGYNQVNTPAKNLRIGLPVSNNSVIYSFYKHVQGYASSDNSQTVPISKIRILNNLIENLSKIKGEAIVKEPLDLKNSSADSLIAKYSKELYESLNSYNSGFNASETGLVVSLTA